MPPHIGSLLWPHPPCWNPTPTRRVAFTTLQHRWRQNPIWRRVVALLQIGFCLHRPGHDHRPCRRYKHFRPNWKPHLAPRRKHRNQQSDYSQTNIRSNFLCQTIPCRKLINFCPRETASESNDSTDFSINTDRLLVSQSTVDIATQIVVPPSLCQRIIMVSHHPSIARNQGQRRMYDTLCHSLYLYHVGADVACTVRLCTSCAKNKARHRRNWQIFRASDPLDFIKMKKVRQFKKTAQGSRCTKVITDQTTSWLAPFQHPRTPPDTLKISSLILG